MSAMSEQIEIFDRQLGRDRHEKALATDTFPDFFDVLVAGELKARLELLTYSFERCLILLPASPAFGEILAQSAQLASLITPPAVQAGENSVSFDCEWLCFAPNSFDCVIAPPGLEKVNDLPGVFAQIANILKPDGLFLAAMLAGDTLAELRHSWLVAEQAHAGGVTPRVAPFADIRQTGNLLQRAGLALPVSDRDTLTLRYDNALSLMQELKMAGCGNNLAARNKSLTGRSLLMKAVEAYQNLFADDDGRIRATLEVNYLTAWAAHERQQKPARPGSASQSLEKYLKEREDKPEPE